MSAIFVPSAADAGPIAVSGRARAAGQPDWAAVEAIDVGKRYANGVDGLRGVSLRVGRGEMVGLLGPSGSGKTTLLRLVAGAIWPTTGTLRVLGEDVWEQRGRRLRTWRRRVANIAQQHSLVPHVSVLQNVLLGQAGQVPLWRALLSTVAPASEEREAAYRLLSALEIGELLNRPVETLSGGQQQRVAVARALLHGGELVVADEPVASVDQETAELLLAILRRLAKADGRTVLVSLHQPALAERFCTRLITLHRGALMDDTVLEVAAQRTAR